MILEHPWQTLISFFWSFLSTSWEIYQSAALYMLFGFFVAGILRTVIPTGKVGALLGGGTFRPVFLSAFIGIPIPLCSCGVIPAAAGLRRQGASKGATLSFLISTPESGVDSISISYALLDPLMTIARPVTGFLTAMVAGITENVLGRRTAPPASSILGSTGCNGRCCASSFSSGGCAAPPLEAVEKNTFHLLIKKIGSGLRYAFSELLGDVGKWFIIGILIAGGITLLIPDTVFSTISENEFLAMVIAMAVGIPMYVCATSSTPIAAALILKGLNPGAALVFLMLGPATNIASISMLYGLLGKRSLAIYLGSMIVCALFFGFLVDWLYGFLGMTPTAVTGQASEIIPKVVETGAAVVLGALLIYSIVKPVLSRYKDPTAGDYPASTQ